MLMMLRQKPAQHVGRTGGVRLPRRRGRGPRSLHPLRDPAGGRSVRRGVRITSPDGSSGRAPGRALYPCAEQEASGIDGRKRHPPWNGNSDVLRPTRWRSDRSHLYTCHPFPGLRPIGRGTCVPRSPCSSEPLLASPRSRWRQGSQGQGPQPPTPPQTHSPTPAGRPRCACPADIPVPLSPPSPPRGAGDTVRSVHKPVYLRQKVASQ